jgi:hypothetical protein
MTSDTRYKQAPLLPRPTKAIGGFPGMTPEAAAQTRSLP